MGEKEASYLSLFRSGELARRAEAARALLSACTLCPRQCRVDRLHGERGYCRSGADPKVSSFGPHYGEEPELVGRYGSGTIFFSNCTMRCEFCQNYSISQEGTGYEVSCDDLAMMMLDLQRRGCHNINVVTPTHYVPQVLGALVVAAGAGLVIPLVYNTGGYDCVRTLKLLDGVFDIYMPDAKYGDDETARRLSHAPHYTKYMKAALIEMQRQVGDLVVDEEGIAVRGLIIRHLVLPDGLAGSREVFRFIADEVSKDAYVNIMDQYRPMWHAAAGTAPCQESLGRPLRREEYEEATAEARRAGLHRGFG